jgi:hypothetical protein
VLRPPLRLPNGHVLDEEFTGLADEHGLMTIAGFGSLLSETSARSTFPSLRNFRIAKVWPCPLWWLLPASAGGHSRNQHFAIGRATDY